MNAVLQAHDLSVSFGRLTALEAVNLTLARGERHALIGPNGAGKTTLINALTGAVAPGKGAILLDGHDVTRLSPDERSRRGLVRTFQVNSLFPDFTALSSLVLAICEREGIGAHWWRALGRQTAVFDEAADWLKRLGINDVAKLPVAHLDYGQQRLLEIALALACRPRILLLDEPAAGLPAFQRHTLLNVINALPGDMSIMLIEHDMNLVFGFAQRISVLAQGRILASGTPGQIAANPDVRAVYLGQI